MVATTHLERPARDAVRAGLGAVEAAYRASGARFNTAEVLAAEASWLDHHVEPTGDPVVDVEDRRALRAALRQLVHQRGPRGAGVGARLAALNQATAAAASHLAGGGGDGGDSVDVEALSGEVRRALADVMGLSAWSHLDSYDDIDDRPRVHAFSSDGVVVYDLCCTQCRSEPSVSELVSDLGCTAMELRTRRGLDLAETGSVLAVWVAGGLLCGAVRGSRGDSYQVVFADGLEPLEHLIDLDVAALAGATAHCSCPDDEMWCKHAVAVAVAAAGGVASMFGADSP
jgi:hypothetical protein